jgi:hypothetical protein
VTKSTDSRSAEVSFFIICPQGEMEAKDKSSLLHCYSRFSLRNVVPPHQSQT